MAKLYFRSKRKKIILFSTITLFMLLIGGWAFLTSWTGSPKDILVVANQFKVDNSWKLESEALLPPKILCLASSGHCPHISRTWKVQEAIDHDQLQSILNRSGWNKVKIDSPNCYHSSDPNSRRLPCYASGTVSGVINNKSGEYYVSVSTDSNAPGINEPTIGFYITE